MKVGIIEGQPGYHSTERVGGFLDGIEGNENFDVVVSIDGKWNVEGGNTAGMDILQSHPDLDMIFAANDYMIIGASFAAKALGRSRHRAVWAMTVTRQVWKKSRLATLPPRSTRRPS